jgi:hypothetical protein
MARRLAASPRPRPEVRPRGVQPRLLFGHVFWPNEILFLDPRWIDSDRLLDFGQATDSNLPALAIARNKNPLTSTGARLGTARGEAVALRPGRLKPLFFTKIMRVATTIPLKALALTDLQGRKSTEALCVIVVGG